jgi:hypothetical protein
MTSPIPRDEREHSIDIAADRLAFLVVCYGALALAAYRSFVLGQPTWDLLGLVVLGGLTGLAYRLRAGVVSRPWVLVLVATVVIAAVIAGTVALVAAPR